MRFLLLSVVLLASPAFAYDINGVGLGGREIDVKKAFPSAHCKDLEWRTDAADRRCDDAKIAFNRIEGRITYYLKAGVIRGFDLRFETKDLERVKAALKSRWGDPLAEVTETIAKRDKAERKVFKMRWEKGPDRAILTAQLEKKRANLEVERGNFFNEVYKIK